MIEHISHCSDIFAYNDINDKDRWKNEYSTIFIIARASILLYIPSKFFGHSCSSAHTPILSTESHFWQAFGYRIIPIMPLDIPPMMKEFPLEESYILPDYLFCQTISYVMVSLPYFYLFPCLIDHTIAHMIYCCVLV